MERMDGDFEPNKVVKDLWKGSSLRDLGVLCGDASSTMETHRRDAELAIS